MPTPMPSASSSCEREKRRERDLRLGQRERVHVRIGAEIVEHAADQRDLARAVLAHGGVLRDHMRHLVRQHRGELGGVVGERDQAARHVELPARQREGVDRRRVEDGDAVALVRPLGRGDELLDRVWLTSGVEPRVLIGAVVGGEDALVLALGGGRVRRGGAAAAADRAG